MSYPENPGMAPVVPRPPLEVNDKIADRWEQLRDVAPDPNEIYALARDRGLTDKEAIEEEERLSFVPTVTPIPASYYQESSQFTPSEIDRRWNRLSDPVLNQGIKDPIDIIHDKNIDSSTSSNDYNTNTELTNLLDYLTTITGNNSGGIITPDTTHAKPRLSEVQMLAIETNCPMLFNISQLPIDQIIRIIKSRRDMLRLNYREYKGGHNNAFLQKSKNRRNLERQERYRPIQKQWKSRKRRRY